MFTHRTLIRVRYADTDKMQFIYNGKYLEYFEVGRTELLRALGLPYNQIEKMGYQLPLLEAFVKYIKAGKYDDLIEIEARANEIPQLKIHIDYTIRNSENNEVIAEGYTEHIFMKEDTKKAVRPPKFYIDALKLHLKTLNE